MFFLGEIDLTKSSVSSPISNTRSVPNQSSTASEPADAAGTINSTDTAVNTETDTAAETAAETADTSSAAKVIDAEKALEANGITESAETGETTN